MSNTDQSKRSPMYRSGFVLDPNQTISFDYKNWQGKEGKRKVMIKGFVWGATEWHPETQFLMLALDLDKGEMRTFAVAEIKNVVKL